MIDNMNPTSQFHPYHRETSVPVAERPLSGLDSVLDKVGIDPTSFRSVRDQMKNLKLNQSFGKVRAYAKANPGKIDYAGGAGSTLQFGTELLNVMAKINLVHVPYNGTGPALIAAMSGEAPVITGPPRRARPIR